MTDRKQGKVFVLSAPAGTGKTTLVKKLTEELPFVVQSVSFTSREKRPNEVDGVDYHFVTREEFRKKLDRGDFLEHAQVYEDDYGTDRKGVEDQLKEGRHVFLVIDTQGAEQIRNQIPAVFIFVFPPSLEELKHRLEHRKTESPDVITERLSWSAREMEAGKHYQYHIVNDDLEKAYKELKQIVLIEDQSEENVYEV